MENGNSLRNSFIFVEVSVYKVKFEVILDRLWNFFNEYIDFDRVERLIWYGLVRVVCSYMFGNV